MRAFPWEENPSQPTQPPSHTCLKWSLSSPSPSYNLLSYLSPSDYCTITGQFFFLFLFDIASP